MIGMICPSKDIRSVESTSESRKFRRLPCPDGRSQADEFSRLERDDSSDEWNRLGDAAASGACPIQSQRISLKSHSMSMVTPSNDYHINGSSDILKEDEGISVIKASDE